MITLEDIVALFGNPAVMQPFRLGRRYPYSLFAKRLLLSRGPHAEYEMFLVGTQASFGVIPSSANIEWGHYHEPSGRPVDALRFALPHDVSNCRLIAHLAYEAYQRIYADHTISNITLLQDLAPYVGLVAERDLLSTQEQQGLLGELLLLQRLIALSHKAGLPNTNALDAWKGWQKTAVRDFARNGVAVEVKATAKQTREHVVTSVRQLELDPHENALFLYSLSVSPDPSGPLRLCDAVNATMTSLGPAAPIFERQLRARGYDTALCGPYQLALPFSTTQFPAALFEVDSSLSRLRLSSFVGNALPANVQDVSYTLALPGVIAPNNPRPPNFADRELLALLT
jgi:hypothetical protein